MIAGSWVKEFTIFWFVFFFGGLVDYTTSGWKMFIPYIVGRCSSLMEYSQYLRRENGV